MRRIKIFHAFAYCDAVARERTSFWLKKHAYTGSSSRRQAVRSVGEFAGHRSTEQCAISLSSKTIFFFSFLLFYFFSESRSIVQLSPRSYAHASRVFHHPRFIATFAHVNILFLFRFSVLYVKICFSVARTMLIWWCIISSLNLLLLLLLLLSLLPLLS